VFPFEKHDFKDSANLGNDANGGTDFSETNIAAADQATDTPTNNFCIINPISNFDSSNKSTLSEGNLYYASVQSGYGVLYGSMGPSSGKWYFEAQYVSGNMHGNSSNVGLIIGIMGSTYNVASSGPGDSDFAHGYVGYGGGYANAGTNTSWGSGDSGTAGDIAMCAFDLDNNKIYWGFNGTWDNSSNPASGTNGVTIAAPSATDLGAYYPIISDRSSIRSYVYAYNFGGCPAFSISSGNADANGYGNFEYAPPSGFYSLCTKNLAEYG